MQRVHARHVSLPAQQRYTCSALVGGRRTYVEGTVQWVPYPPPEPTLQSAERHPPPRRGHCPMCPTPRTLDNGQQCRLKPMSDAAAAALHRAAAAVANGSRKTAAFVAVSANTTTTLKRSAPRSTPLSDDATAALHPATMITALHVHGRCPFAALRIQPTRGNKSFSTFAPPTLPPLPSTPRVELPIYNERNHMWAVEAVGRRAGIQHDEEGSGIGQGGRAGGKESNISLKRMWRNEPRRTSEHALQLSTRGGVTAERQST